MERVNRAIPSIRQQRRLANLCYQRVEHVWNRSLMLTVELQGDPGS
jgi:hypothetical protein